MTPSSSPPCVRNPGIFIKKRLLPFSLFCPSLYLAPLVCCCLLSSWCAHRLISKLNVLFLTQSFSGLHLCAVQTEQPIVQLKVLRCVNGRRGKCPKQHRFRYVCAQFSEREGCESTDRHGTVVNSDFYGDTVVLGLHVHVGSSIRVPVESRTTADAQTGGCQQHTNKLSGENQSGSEMTWAVEINSSRS